MFAKILKGAPLGNHNAHNKHHLAVLEKAAGQNNFQKTDLGTPSYTAMKDLVSQGHLKTNHGGKSSTVAIHLTDSGKELLGKLRTAKGKE